MRFSNTILLALLVSNAVFAGDWVTQKCTDIPEFLSTWSRVTAAFPAILKEMQAIGEESGDYTWVEENGVLVNKIINMDVCTFTLPTSAEKVTDGLRTLLTHKQWTRDNIRYARGVLVEYILTTDPRSGIQSRQFVSLSLCREPRSCVRRGIIPASTPEPVKPDPKPEPQPGGPILKPNPEPKPGGPGPGGVPVRLEPSPKPNRRG